MSDGGGDNTGVSGEWSADELIPFGKYVLLDRLSSGATAAVYRANVRGEAGFERLVAIKRILPHMAGDRDFVDTFVREAKTVARLTHAAICPIYELGKVGESLYMAIEYIQGKDLGSIMRLLSRRGETIPPVIAAWIAARLCEALDYAHNLKNTKGERKGIIHRDLSPSNVIISYEGQVKLIDFGLAKAVGRAQSTNVTALKMKIGYMSPEMVKGKPLDGRSDLFGVGVCLYEMITGRRLFVGANDIEALKLVGNAVVPPPSAVTDDTPEELEIIIMRALQREPADRFQEAADMGEALTAYLRKTDPTFGLQQLAQWMSGLFGEEIAEERAHVTALLAASNDVEVLKERRTFFASPSGAAARARAEIERRLSTEPPPVRSVGGPEIPKPAGVPPEATAAPIVSSLPPPVPVSSAQPPPAGAAAAGATGFEDEPTSYYGDKPGGFENEPTQFLTDGDVEVVDTGGFDEEATTIFFNKEDGVGLQEMLEEINDVERPAPLNRPIIAPELGLAMPAGMQPGAPMTSRPPSPVPARTVSSAPAPRMAPRPSPPLDYGSSAEDDLPARPQRNWPIAASFVVLFAVIGGLVVMTPLGIALGLRSAPAGAIELRTNPQVAASVHLDDVYRGTTPLRLEGVQPGLRRVRFVASGYGELQKEIEVQPGSTALIEVAMVADRPAQAPPAEPPLAAGLPAAVAGVPALPPATLTTSAPVAAAPESQGTSTSRRRKSRRSGESTEPTPSATAPSTAAPVAASSAGGTLVVNSVPWAYVIIDGRETGRTTPLMGYTLSLGPHEIQLRTATGQVHVQRIDVQPGQTVRVSRRF